MLSWLEHELNTTIDIRKAFTECAAFVGGMLIVYGMFRFI